MANSSRDERDPLLPQSKVIAEESPIVIEDEIESWSRFLNPQIGRRPWRLFEWADLTIFPAFLRRKCQSVLTSQWTTRLPLIQSRTPASRASRIVLDLIDAVSQQGASKISVIDLCAGSGGPIPAIEKQVNEQRLSSNQTPIPFVLADLYPHLDAWMESSSRSANLSFLPGKVDATNPPPPAISATAPPSTTPSRNDTSTDRSSSRVIRLYCLSFHHFADPDAINMLMSTMTTADAFAIIELQDRRLFSLILMLLDIPLVFAGTIFWHWRDPIHLFFTYIIPVLPLVMSFDGFVSSLRTRTFEEVIALIDEGSAEDGVLDLEVAQGTVRKWMEKSRDDGERRSLLEARRRNWVFRGIRERHTWPIGYLNAVVGWKQVR